jgi:hypothetical protein
MSAFGGQCCCSCFFGYSYGGYCNMSLSHLQDVIMSHAVTHPDMDIPVSASTELTPSDRLTSRHAWEEFKLGPGYQLPII